MEREMGAKVSGNVNKYTKKARLEPRLEKTLKEMVHLLKILEIYIPSGLQTGEFIFAFFPLGSSCGRFGVPIGCMMQKVQPKRSQNDVEITEGDSKRQFTDVKVCQNDAPF